MRRAGSAALDLAYVAAGRLDGYWESGLESWDMAAGALIVREAGGLVTDYNGDEQFSQDNGESGRRQIHASIIAELLRHILKNSKNCASCT